MPNKDYLIVLDLDGTLLTKKKEIPFLTKLYLRKLNKKGYNIVLGSGRPARNIGKFQGELRLNNPMIALNGLHVHYPNNEDKDRRIFFDPKKIKEIVKIVGKHFKIKNIICETDKDIYITNKDAYLEPDFWLTNMKTVYGTLDINLKNPVMTFLMELEDPKFNQRKLKSLFKNTGCNVRCWVDDYQGFIEIYQEHSNKARAILDLAKEMNIKKENIYAFGDDLNDIEMLRDLPNAYVMKNAKPNVKKISHHETHYDNEHEGVRRELKVILKNLK